MTVNISEVKIFLKFLHSFIGNRTKVYEKNFMAHYGNKTGRTLTLDDNYDSIKKFCLNAKLVVEKENSEISLFASGSELEIAVNAAEKLALEGIKARVISVPSIDRFYLQDEKYKADIINTTPKIVIEAGVRQSWDYILNKNDIFIGMSTFGASAPAKDLYKHFSITENKVMSSVKLILNK
jgi:transketolase